MSDPTCATCRFFRPLSPTRTERGHCFRYPPRPDEGPIPDSLWCGEHSPRPESLAELPEGWRLDGRAAYGPGGAAVLADRAGAISLIGCGAAPAAVVAAVIAAHRAT